jgi:hypothetical protein
LITRPRLRGCDLQVQEAAEQRVVMKTITRSNIRGGIAPTRYSKNRALRFAPFLFAKRFAGLLETFLRYPHKTTWCTFVLNPLSLEENKLRVQSPRLTLEELEFHR